MLGLNGESYTRFLLYSLDGRYTKINVGPQVPIHRMKKPRRHREMKQEREMGESERVGRRRKESRIDLWTVKGRNSTNPCWFIILLDVKA